MAEYKVVNSMKTGEFTGQGGVVYKYATMFEGQTDSVEVNQKPDTPAPKAGDVLNGTIEDTKWGKRFKKDFGGGRGGYARDDNAIRAQWAIGQGIQLLIARGYTVSEESKLEQTAKDLYAMVDRVKGLAAVEKVKEVLGGEEVDLPPVDVYNE